MSELLSGDQGVILGTNQIQEQRPFMALVDHAKPTESLVGRIMPAGPIIQILETGREVVISETGVVGQMESESI